MLRSGIGLGIGLDGGIRGIGGEEDEFKDQPRLIHKNQTSRTGVRELYIA